MSVWSFVHIHSTLSTRARVRIGSSMSIMGKAYGGAGNTKFSLLSSIRISSSLSLRTIAKFGSNISIFNYCDIGSSFSVRNYLRLGSGCSITAKVHIE